MAEYCRIMIIDDEFIMRQGIKHMLDWEKEGFKIVGEAANGKDGLDLIETLCPHIVLCDIVMPIMDGVDFSKMVWRLHPEIQIIILSSYDNFEYVKSTLQNGAVDYVLKPTLNPTELLQILKKAADRIPGLRLRQEQGVTLEKSLELFLMGEESTFSGPKIVEHFPYTFYRVFGLYIKQDQEQRKSITNILYEKLREGMSSCGCCCWISALLRDEMFCVVLNYRVSDGQELIQYMEKITTQLTVFHERVYGVLSPEFSTRSKIRQVYEDIVFPEALQAFYNEGIHFCILDEKRTVKPQPRFDFNYFVEFLQEKRFREALEQLSTYVAKALEQEMEEVQLKNQLKNMLYNMIDAMELKRESKEMKRYQIFNRVDDAYYERELKEALIMIKQEIYDHLKEEEQGDDPRLRQILSYIENNYMEDLDLKEIADVFSFNYYYLSAYFNQHMEEGFSEYLNRIRIEKAQRLLRNNEYSIAQISGEVGYSDPSYFCRVFKKITKDTPSSWRRRHRQVGEAIR